MSWINREDWKIVNKYKDWVSKKEIEEDAELKDLIMFIILARSGSLAPVMNCIFFWLFSIF